jgi:phosphatidylglycerol---prolipoprotein diacylglyceryl transferase
MANEAYYHPTFLYESVWNLAGLAILLGLFYRYPNLKRGSLFLSYVIFYSLGRFWIEGLRMDSLMLGPLRVAQFISLAGITLGCLGLAWLYLRNRPLPDVVKRMKPAPELGLLEPSPPASEQFDEPQP